MDSCRNAEKTKLIVQELAHKSAHYTLWLKEWFVVTAVLLKSVGCAIKVITNKDGWLVIKRIKKLWWYSFYVMAPKLTLLAGGVLDFVILKKLSCFNIALPQCLYQKYHFHFHCKIKIWNAIWQLPDRGKLLCFFVKYIK